MKTTLKKLEFSHWFHSQLEHYLEKEEREEILRRLLEHHGMSRLEWAVTEEFTFDKAVWEPYIVDLQKDRPIQYILGYEFFAGMSFVVNESVLIPRPETEELVNWIIADTKGNIPRRVLEVGTGSGCISITLKKGNKDLEVTATDICTEALQLAVANAKNLSTVVNFIQDDVLDSQLKERTFDIIVSNPPYIPIEDASTLATRVREYEPKLALFTREGDPLQFYRAIMEYAGNSLTTGGCIYFEIHEDYSAELKALAKLLGFTYTFKEDFYGKIRMLKLEFKSKE